jgi:hypothetical protein
MFILYAINEGTPLSRDSEGQQHPVADDANVNPRFPSPEVLAQVIDRTQQLLGGSAASALSVCHLSLLVMFCIFSFANINQPENALPWSRWWYLVWFSCVLHLSPL